MVQTFRASLAYRRAQAEPQTLGAQPGALALASIADDAAIATDEGEAGGGDAEPRAGEANVPRPLPEPDPVEAPVEVPVYVAASHDSLPAESDPADTGVVHADFEAPQEIAATPAEPAGAPPLEEPPTEADTWQAHLERAITRLEQETSAAPATSTEIAAHAKLRLLQLAAGNQESALRPIDGVPPGHQDFWAKLLFGLSSYLDDAAQPEVRTRATLARHHLDEATDLLGEIAALEVQNLAFCESIRGFGIYEPLEQPKFRAGEQVKLYAEVANYKCDQTAEGFRTVLATSYEVLDVSDQRVDSGEFPQVEDVCRSRRRDFHIQYGVNLPSRIYPGKYRLELTIEDMQSRKLGRASVEFEIADTGRGKE
jgi:hypothetical protein